MIARELLVRLGFDIDEGKFQRFSHNVETLKSNISGIKNKISLNIDSRNINGSKLERLTQGIVPSKAKIARDTLDTATPATATLKDQPSLGHSFDNLKAVKEQMAKVKEQINQQLYPRINTKELYAYNEELKALSKSERSDILALNKLEKATLKDQLHGDRLKYKQLQTVHSKLSETQKEFNAAAKTAKAAHMTFSRFFTKAALVGLGSFLLAVRKTLKDAQGFKEGGGKTDNGKADNSFSGKQLNSADLFNVDRFNISLKQLKKTLGELRNRFVIDLLPVFKENLDLLNDWLLKNKALINSKIKIFVETLAAAFKILASATKVIFGALNPLVDLIGGWGVILGGITGTGILSWLVRLGLFLGTGAAAIRVFAGAIRVLTLALLANPVCLAITAIVTLLALLADEFIVTARGGDSLMNRFAGLKKMGDSFIETLKEIRQWLVKVKSNMIDFTIGGMGKVKEFFTGYNDRKALQKALQKPHEILQDTLVPNSKEHGRLNITYAMKDRYKLASPAFTNYRNSGAENGIKTINSNNRNTFNVNINVPKGTSEEQSRIIAREVQRQVQAELEFHNEKTLNAIGAI